MARSLAGERRWADEPHLPREPGRESKLEEERTALREAARMAALLGPWMGLLAVSDRNR
jgi:hypothetical protein